MSTVPDDQVEAQEGTGKRPAEAGASPKRRRGKSRSFDFSAIEHVGNDATEGGFLGDDAAESERRGSSEPTASLPPAPEPPAPADEEPARELRAVKIDEPPAGEEAAVEATRTVPPDDASNAVSLPNQAAGAEAEEPPGAQLAEQEKGTDRPIVEAPASAAPEAISTEEGTPPSRPATRQRRNDGPGFSAASAEPTLRPRRKKAGSPGPVQATVLQSFIKHRTERNWVTWSGRIEGETKARLLDKADDDAASSKRNLMPGHYLDAALRKISELSPEELASLANEWLIERWSGEHPPGVSIQAGVSPDMSEFLKGLKRTMRGQRGAGSGGIILDVVSAAVDRFLDEVDEEGPFPSVR
ncbi:hypothetical protein OG906_42085 (plasmid) [Streptomyces sp. NBC_01426]|uniref:hypothetical protein n=1 Tax=Streptomyces sp. NBC_01426 TaxID=2975866 RepID=UPI002E32B4B1|nr:hypothetical protein [Streptomyces sp. NBC_01426]